MSASSSFVPTLEAAYIAGRTDREMNRLVDEHIFPAWLFDQSNGRSFARLGAAFARFYFSTERDLAADFRRHIIVTDMAARLLPRADKDQLLGLKTLPQDVNWLVHKNHLQVNLESFVHETVSRMRDVERAEDAVRSDPEIMGGDPVFAGTRVPIDIVLSSLRKGIDPERVRASYPHVSKDAIASAQLYSLIHPRRGRPPRRLSEQHPDWKLKSRKVVRAATKA